MIRSLKILLSLFFLLLLLLPYKKVSFPVAEQHLYLPSSIKVGIGTEANSYFLYKGVPSGFQLDLLNVYAAYLQKTFHFIRIDSIEERIKHLEDGEIDIAVFDDYECFSKCDSKSLHVSRIVDPVHSFSWAVRNSSKTFLYSVDIFLQSFSRTSDYKLLISRYYKVKPGNNTTTESQLQLSPYDGLIKKYSKQLGWSWQLLAALIYQESKFIDSLSSHRGAHGLMQVMPHTADFLGYQDVSDPETNIQAGITYLRFLKKQLQKEEDIPESEMVNFMLASYNAGYGRILYDCRSKTDSLGRSSNKWSELEKTIIYLTDKNIEIPPDLSFKRFRGQETVRFVREVQERYQHYKNLLPD